MNKTTKSKLAGVALALPLSVAGCAAPQTSNVNNANTRTATATASPTGTMPGTDHGNMNHGGMNHGNMNHSMMDHANMKSSPNAASAPYDLQFLDTMIAHHQGAVDMARPAVEKAQHTELREFARKIVADQEREIAEMRRYREQWFAGRPEALNMEMPGMTDSMKGMDMRKLDAATGNDYDLMFLEQMTPHHVGAVVMSKDALNKAEHAEIKTLANQIIKSQEAEIAQMNEWRKRWSSISSAAHGTSQAYTGQETREIKALSADDVRAYLRGEGMGLAKAAELNRYPGPLHVLELADELELSSEQREKTRLLREGVVRDARLVGEQIVKHEAELDQAFARDKIDAGSLRRITGEVARLQGDLREVHLRAHLAMKRLLSPNQVERYVKLRGYGAGGHQHQTS